MNDEQIEKILAALSEDVHAPKHRTALRAALMREHAKARRPYFTLQSISKYLTMKTALIPLSSFAVLTVILVGTLGITHKSAEAQELVQRSIARAFTLAPAMRAQIETQLKADMMQTLEEAYRAPDLRILSREEYEKEAQFTMATSAPKSIAFSAAKAVNIQGSASVSNVTYADAGATFTVSAEPMAVPSAGTVTVSAADPFSPNAKPVAVYSISGSAMKMDPKDIVIDKPVPGQKFAASATVVGEPLNQPVKYLRYTSPEGRKVTLGLDENDTPIFRIEELTANDVVRGTYGTMQVQGKALQQFQVDMKNPEGGFETVREVKVGN